MRRGRTVKQGGRAWHLLLVPPALAEPSPSGSVPVRFGRWVCCIGVQARGNLGSPLWAGLAGDSPGLYRKSFCGSNATIMNLSSRATGVSCTVVGGDAEVHLPHAYTGKEHEATRQFGSGLSVCTPRHDPSGPFPARPGASGKPERRGQRHHTPLQALPLRPASQEVLAAMTARDVLGANAPRHLVIASVVDCT